MNIKKIRLVVFAWLTFYPLTALASTGGEDNIFLHQDGFLKKFANGNENIFTQIMEGSYRFNIKEFAKSAADVFLQNINDAKNALAAIIVVSLMLSVFYMTGNSLFNKDSSDDSPVQVFMLSVISVWLVHIINTCADKTAQCILNIINFMKISMPVYAGVGIFTGRASGTLYDYVFMIFGGILYGGIIKLVIPAVVYIGILNIISSVFNLEFGKTTYKTVHSTLKTFLEILIALFAAIYSIWMVSGRSASFAGIGAVKFAVAKFVPVAGGFLADAADGITGAFLGIKSSTGLACAVGVLLIAYAPVLYIGVYVIIAKILVVITSPLGVGSLTEIFKTGEDTISMLFVLIICVSTLFVITVSVVLSGIL